MNDLNLPNGTMLRGWQTEFHLTYKAAVRSGRQNFLLVATPGAGKTIAMLAEAYLLMQQGLIDWVTVTVPSDNLRRQWAVEAHKRFGLDLFPGKGFCPPDYQGEVITYMQLANSSGLYRKRCYDRRVFLIADEVHHLAEQAMWGAEFKQAFDGAAYRLLGSGTPFRSDNQPIPWVVYEQIDGSRAASKADYSYGYSSALVDGVCRHVIFPCYEGQAEWIHGGESNSASLADRLSKAQSSRRLTTVLDLDGGWMQQVLVEACGMLESIRRDHRDAGGLVIAKDQKHAEKIRDFLTEVTGEIPEIATSDDPKASAVINAFRDSASPWIVAVKMISEGVDIKRLRVGVYATNITTEMFFRQAVGRVIRVVGGLDDETAYFFMPHVQELEPLYMEFKAERDHVIDLDLQMDDRQKSFAPDDNEDAESTIERIFVPLDSSAVLSGHVYDGKHFSPADLDSVSSYAQALGIPSAKVAALLQMMGSDRSLAAPVSISQPKPNASMRYDRAERLKSEASRRAGELAGLLGGVEIRDIHASWIRRGGMRQAKATEEDLLKKIEWLKTRIAEAGRNEH